MMPKFTVSFDSNGGSPVSSQFVEENGRAVRPEEPAVSPLAHAGLYKKNVGHVVFNGWYHEDELVEFNFHATPINKDIKLKARWTYPDRIIEINNDDITIASDDFVTAFDEARRFPDTYVIVLRCDIVIDPQTIDADNLNLTIVGLGGTKTISPAAAGHILFDIGIDPGTGNDPAGIAKLTIDNNITLVGTSGSNSPLVQVQFQSEFIMLDGSKITGNGSNDIATKGSTVYVANKGIFTMAGGEISGNTNSYVDPNHATNNGAIVIINGDSVFNMKGGSINNGSENKDVCILAFQNTVGITIAFIPFFTLSGNAVISNLLLSIDPNMVFLYYPSINVESGWTGTIANLYFYFELNDSTVADLLYLNTTYKVLTGTRLTDEINAQIKINGLYTWMSFYSLQGYAFKIVDYTDPWTHLTSPCGFLDITRDDLLEIFQVTP